MKASELEKRDIEKYYPAIARMTDAERYEVIMRNEWAKFGSSFFYPSDADIEKAGGMDKGQMFFFAIGKYDMEIAYEVYGAEEAENYNRQCENESVYWL